MGRLGQVVVQPGAILHLDCLADRRRGNPGWSWTNLYKDYPTGDTGADKYHNSQWRIARGIQYPSSQQKLQIIKDFVRLGNSLTEEELSLQVKNCSMIFIFIEDIDSDKIKFHFKLQNNQNL